ncbi:transporter substrate-binding domain-containing protein [Ensifer sp. ENS11]|uniref:transporter substrate-binding domain-containing protein n=1 Tax=Ensifer sp. ENS11 TaxID=2769291 RepID=UPI00178227EB|nr:transporter substrate-binding domain-containing protein [Ensifer sp. ENS11]MBD9489490.1 transporter substrate-binding domain-containing protein [Ensifer sp. ENS11]
MFSSTTKLRIVQKAAVAASIFAATFGATTAHALTTDEVKQRGKLVVGVLTDYPPFGGTDANQEPAGYDVDVSRLMAKELGVELQIVPVTGPNRIPFLLTRKIDAVVATFGIIKERTKQVNFSNPYSAMTIYILGSKDLQVSKPDDLKEKRVGVTRASTQDTAVMEIAPKEATIMRFDDDATTTQSIISGQVDVIGASNTVLATINTQFPDLQIQPKFVMKEQANGIAFRKDDTQFLEWTNEFIARIVEDGRLSEVNQRWFGAPLKELPAMPKF